jgi:hypothetical protein
VAWGRAGAIEERRRFERHRLQRLDEFEAGAVGLLPVELEGLVTDGESLAAAQPVATTGALRRATASISPVMSTPITRPEAPTTWDAMKQILPVPLPRSRTVSPGWR